MSAKGKGFNVRVDGIKEGLTNLERATDVSKASGAAYNGLELTMGKSKDQCPVEFGTLRSTGTVDAPNIRGSRWTIELGYGSAAAAYAIYVHENLYAHHPVGKAKFLEDPLMEDVENITNRVRAAVFG